MRGKKRLKGALVLVLLATGVMHAQARSTGRWMTKTIKMDAKPGHTYQARALVEHSRADHATFVLKFSSGRRTLRRRHSRQKLDAGQTTLVTEATAPERAARVSVRVKLRRTAAIEDLAIVDLSSSEGDGGPVSGGDVSGEPPAGADGAHRTARGDLYVSPAGSDANDGRTRDRALRTIQEAVTRAKAGDTIVVLAGTYPERVKLDRTGVTLAAERGATIDGGDSYGLGSSTSWTSRGDGTWVARLGYRAFNLTWDRGHTGNFLYVLRSNQGLVPRNSPTSCCQGPDDALTDPRVIADIVPASFRSEADGTTFVRFAHGEDPRREALRFAPESAAALEIAGDRNTVRGFTIENASYGILVTAGAGNVIEHNTVLGGFHSIHVDGPSVSGTQLRYNRITLNFSHTMDPTDPYHWYVWNLIRNFSDSPRVGIAILESGGGNRIHHNLIHEHFSGIHHTPLKGVQAWPVADGAPDVSAFGRDLEIAYNRMEKLGNDGVLLGAAEVGTRVHHNVIVRPNAAVRMFGPSSGPLYVYANHFESPSGYRTVASNRYPRGREYNFGGIFMYAESLARMFVYHNDITAETCYNMGSTWIGSHLGTPRHTGVPNAYYVENEAHCGATFGHDSSEWNGSDGTVVDRWTGGQLPGFDASPIGVHDLDRLGNV